MPKPSPPGARSRAKSGSRSGTNGAARRPARKPAFAKKNQPPTAAAFSAQLPLSLGKRLESARGFLLKQKGVSEDVYFYGPRAGWGLRYLAEGRALCALFVHGERPLAVLSLDAETSAAVDWSALSVVATRARGAAHGSPSLLWLDLPLDASGAGDFKVLLRAKLGALRGA